MKKSLINLGISVGIYAAYVGVLYGKKKYREYKEHKYDSNGKEIIDAEYVILD